MYSKDGADTLGRFRRCDPGTLTGDLCSEGMVGALGAYKALAHLMQRSTPPRPPSRQLGAANTLRPKNRPSRSVRGRHCRHTFLTLTNLTTLDEYGADQSIPLLGCGVVYHLPSCRCAVLRRTRLSCTSQRQQQQPAAASVAPTNCSANSSANSSAKPSHPHPPSHIPHPTSQQPSHPLIPRRADPFCGPVPCAQCPVRQPSRTTRPIPSRWRATTPAHDTLARQPAAVIASSPGSVARSPGRQYDSRRH